MNGVSWDLVNEGQVLEPFRTVAILGVGLIGGSIGMALRTRGLAAEVVGIGRDPGSLDEAERLGAVNRSTTDLCEGVGSAEVVVVCTPVNRVAEDVQRCAEAAGPDVLITDAGSSKRQIVEAVERQPAAASVFVGAHPLAGSERRGAAHARADLFEGRVCVLTPTSRTPADRLRRAARLLDGARLPRPRDGARPSTTRSWPTPAICRMPWPPPWRRRSPPTGCRWPPAPSATARASPPPTPASGRRSFATTAGLCSRPSIPSRNASPSFKYALMTDDEDAIRRWWDEARQRRDGVR